MYLSNAKERKSKKFSNLFFFLEKKRNEWNVTTLLLEPCFEMKGWKCRGGFGVLVKFLLNLILFHPIFLIFGKWKMEVLKENGGMSVPSNLFYYLQLI